MTQCPYCAQPELSLFVVAGNSGSPGCGTILEAGSYLGTDSGAACYNAAVGGKDTMNPGQFLPIVLAISTTVGLIVAARRLKKEGPQKAQELYRHLDAIGVEVSMPEEPVSQTTTGHKRPWGQKLVGTIKLIGSNVDSIDVIGTASQYGINYYLEYLVRISGFVGPKKKTRMVKKKTSFFGGMVADIEWKGDDSLAQRLNYDYQLKEKLLHMGPDALKGSIVAMPEVKHGYARVRTSYSLPTRAVFENIDTIARHIRSEW